MIGPRWSVGAFLPNADLREADLQGACLTDGAAVSGII